MRHHRSDVVERALAVLDDYGLASLTMRRLGSELGVQPSALYHHFLNKQTLLAAVADEILTRGRRPRTASTWDCQVAEVCRELRDSMLAFRDGADVVATVFAFGLGASGPAEELEELLAVAGLPDDLVAVGSRTLVHFVFGHTFEEQTALQANSLGAIDLPARASQFDLGLRLVLDGLRSRVGQQSLSPTR